MPGILGWRRDRTWFRPAVWDCVRCGFLDAILPLTVFLVGLVPGHLIIEGLGTRFSQIYRAHRPATLQSTDTFLHVQLVFGVFLVTNVIALIVVLVCVANNRNRLKPFAGQATGAAVALGILLSAIPLIEGPYWKIMAEPLFDDTVVATLREFGLMGNKPGTWDTLDVCVKFSGVAFTVSACFVLFSVAALHREFRTKVAGSSVGSANVETKTRDTISYIYRLRTLLLLAAVAMVTGIVNMVAWRYWPLAFLHPNTPDRLAELYSGLAEGSVISQGATFTVTLFAIFYRPFAELNDYIDANPTLYDKVTHNGMIARTAAWMKDALLQLAPLGVSIAATLVPAHLTTPLQ